MPMPNPRKNTDKSGGGASLILVSPPPYKDIPSKVILPSADIDQSRAVPPKAIRPLLMANSADLGVPIKFYHIK